MIKPKLKLTGIVLLLVVILTVSLIFIMIRLNNSSDVSMNEKDDLVAASSLFDLYETWDGTIRVNNKEYHSGDTIFFTDESIEISLNFRSIEHLNITTDDLNAFEQQYVNLIGAPPDWNFTTLYAQSSPSNVLHIKLEPLRNDFTLELTPKQATEERKHFHFQYTNPFTYTITTPNDDHVVPRVFDSYVPVYAEIEKPQYLRVEFSKPVQQDSVESKLTTFAEIGVEYKAEWVDATTLQLEIQLEEEHLSEYIFLDFYQIVSEDGMLLQSYDPALAPVVRIIPAVKKSYGFAQDTLHDYNLLSQSPDGEWFLTEEGFQVQGAMARHYRILNNEGRVFTNLPFEPWVNFVDWIEAETLLFYEPNKLFTYDASTGRKENVMTLTEGQILAADYESETGRLVVATGTQIGEKATADLHLFESVFDDNPRNVPALFDVFCHGICPTHLEFIDQDNIVFSEYLQKLNWTTLQIESIQMEQ